MRKFLFILLLAAFAVLAAPIIAKQIQIEFDIGLTNELKADKVCLGAVCKTAW